MNTDIIKAAELIKNGGLVAFPTETVYGLGADAFNAEAVAKIFEVKERPDFDPLIVHVSQPEDIQLVCQKVDDYLSCLIETFWPGPLTIVVPKKEMVPDIVTSGLATVAVRMPDHPIAIELIKKSGTPLAAPSANKFGMLSPTEAVHVKKQLKNIDCIIDGGKTKVGLESTVIELTEQGFILLRPGAVSSDDIEKHVPKDNTTKKTKNKPHSPGLLKSHYSPQKPIYIKGCHVPDLNRGETGLISFGLPEGVNQYKQVEVLSPEKDLRQAAVNLFGAIHKLEDADVKYILVEPVPEKGIGIAIMDRLRKASYKYINKNN